MKLSLLQKAMLAIIVILLPILITFLITYRLNKEHVQETILAGITAIADGYEGQIYQFLERSKGRALDFSSDGFIRDQLMKINQGQKSAVEPLNQHLIKNKMPLDKTIQAIYIISINNRVASSTDLYSIGKYTSVERFLKNGEPGQTIMESDAGFTGFPEIEISASITDRITGELIGIIVNVVQLSELNKIIRGEFTITHRVRWGKKTMEIYLVNENKLMITESMFVKDAILNQIVDTLPVRACLESNKETTSAYKSYRGERVIGTSICIPALKWTLMVEVDEYEALRPLTQMRRGVWISGIVVSGFIGILFVFSLRNVITPLRIMASAAKDIAKGNYGVSIPVQTSDEIGALSETFNQMAHEIGAKTEELRRLSQAIEQSINVVFMTDINGNIEYVNPMFESVTGWSKDEVIGQNPRILAAGLTTKTQYKELWDTILAGKTFRYTFQNKKKNGQLYWANALISPIKNRAGETTHFLAIQEDITEKKESEERAQYLESYDALTGLLNRARFMELMDEWIIYAKTCNQTGALLLINIDDFKYINEAYGHSTGDEFLRRIASMLKDTIHDLDVGYMKKTRKENIVAHLGGDEFAVFLSSLGEKEVLGAVQLILTKLERLYIPQVSAHLTATIGIVSYPEHGVTVKELFTKADAAMFHAKETGKNKCHIFHAEDYDLIKMHSRLDWKERIREAVENGRFVPWFQPILDLKDNKIHHYEALARLRQEDGAILLPSAFIEAAEIFNLIGSIDRIVTEKAMRFQEKMAHNGKHVFVSMNLSGKNMGDEELLLFLNSKIKEIGLDPGYLIFEITETAAVHNMAKAVNFIKSLKSSGCHFSLDDFGVGFTSFVYLREMGVDYIKIDGSFIKNLHQSRNDQLFVKAIADVAQGMGIKTIAEFVENKETIKLLKEYGIDYAQGYAIGKPAPWEEIYKAS